jgi:hypothetical protein
MGFIDSYDPVIVRVHAYVARARAAYMIYIYISFDADGAVYFLP